MLRTDVPWTDSGPCAEPDVIAFDDRLLDFVLQEYGHAPLEGGEMPLRT